MSEPSVIAPTTAAPGLSLASHFEGIAHGADQLRIETKRLIETPAGEQLNALPGATMVAAELQYHLFAAVKAAARLHNLAAIAAAAEQRLAAQDTALHFPHGHIRANV